MKNFIKKRGFSTIEILIAFSFFVLIIGGVAIIAFGDQAVALDTQLSSQAVSKAEKGIETLKSEAAQDWNSATSTSLSAQDSDYQRTQISVNDISPCLKYVSSTVVWQASPVRPEKTEYTTLLTNSAEAIAMGGDCAATPSFVSWNNPDNFNSVDFSPSGIPATGIDVDPKIVFMTGTASASNKPDFFIFDARNANVSTPPVLSWSLDTGDGLNAVDAIESPSYFYAFVASNDLTTTPLKQLMVIQEAKDLSTAPVVVASATLPAVSGTCPNSCPQGRSIYFYGNFLYVGTHRLLTGGANEFHVFDVSDPLHPVWVGSKKLNHNINTIKVRTQMVGGVQKKIAYLATSGNTTDLIVLDVTNPASIPAPLALMDVGGTQDAETLDVVGAYLYLGKDRNPSGPEFFVIDVSNPSSPQLKGSADISMQSGSIISTVRVIGSLAFIGTTDSNDPFQVWNISDPLNMTRHDVTHYNFSQKTVGLDYEDDRIYTANQSNDALRIIYSASPFTYTLSNAGSITVTQGSAGNTTVTRSLTSGTGSNALLTASGLPAGAAAAFTNNPCIPTCSSVLTITTSFPTTPAGTYPITVTGGSQTTTFNLIVNPQPFDYSLSTPANVTAFRAGASANTSITATIVSGAGTVNFTNSALPSGVTVNYSATSCTPTCTTTLTFSAADNAALGANTITITGSSPSHSKSFTLTVNAPTFDYSLPSTLSNITLTRGSATAVPITVTVTMVAGAVPQSVTLTAPNPAPADITISPGTTASCTPSATAPYTCSVTFNYKASASATKKTYNNQMVTGSLGTRQTNNFKIIVN